LFENSPIHHYQTDISYTCGINYNAYAHARRDSYAGQHTLSGPMRGFIHFRARGNTLRPYAGNRRRANTRFATQTT
jgi:hypothetical protein